MADLGLSIAGLLGLIGTTLEVLGLGFTIKDRAKDFGVLSVRLRMEGFLLGRWAENVGIVKTGIASGPDAIDERRVAATLYELIKTNIECLLKLFDESQGLVKAYKGEPGFVPLHEPDARPRTLVRILKRVGTDLSVTRPKALRWAVRDGTKFQKLVDDITCLVALLIELLPLDQAVLERQLLIDSVTDTTSAQSARDVYTALQSSLKDHDSSPTSNNSTQAISAAARVRSALPLWNTHATTSRAHYENLFSEFRIENPGFSPPQLPTDLARIFTTLARGTPQLQTPIMVEWRLNPRDQDIPETTFEQDVADLVQILALVSQNNKFHALKCLGYFIGGKLQSGMRYGVIFQVPQADRGRQPLHRTLEEAMSDNAEDLPELGLRFYLALELATAVYYLLTTGWLHKGIRAHNVVLFERRIIDDKSIQAGLSLYLAGYEYSRPDVPAPRSLNDKDSEDLDLYRHPNASSTQWDTAEYKSHGYLRQYDIYSLGVVLLEIGLWHPATYIKKGYEARKAKRMIPQTERFVSYLQRKAAADLPSRMGQKYANLVACCLSIRVDNNRELDAAVVLEELDRNVLVPLSSCQV
jgi:Prion-inhibition and propagation